MLTNDPADPPKDNPPSDPPKDNPPADPPKDTPPSNDPPAAAASWDKIRESLPEDLRNDKSLEVVKDVEGLVKSYIHAQKSVGKEKVALPDPKYATEDDWKEVFKKIGNPESLEDYKLNVEGENAIPEEVMEDLKKTAHSQGILPWQFEKVLSVLNQKGSEMSEKAQAEAQTKYQERVASLKKEWGNAYDAQVRRANIAFKEFLGSDEERNQFIEEGLGAHPLVVKVLANASKLLTEDQFRGHGDGELGHITPNEALEKAREIQGDSNHPYRNPSHPNHKAAKKEVADLYKIAFPE